jgi:ABC-type Fe3+-siderophore transport system permease subunit
LKYSSKLWLCGFALTLLLSALLLLLGGLDKPFSDPIEVQILLQLRLPLVLTACLVGSALALSSANLQVLLHNPLADPGIIGITSGASLCAALFLLVGGQLAPTVVQYLLPLCCFLGAILSTALIYGVARKLAANHSAVILAGIAISTIAGAIVAWLHFFSDAQSMRNLTFWLMGSLHQTDWPILLFATPLLLILITYLSCQGRALNWYYFGHNSAQLAGLDVRKFHKKMLLLCALSVGAAVSMAGSIAFVGLLVPHLLRNFFGYDNRFILPASALLGACLLLWVELLSGWLFGISLPVSMITATLGGPIFLYSIARMARVES